MIGVSNVVSDHEELRKYNCDWTGAFVGNAPLALLPRNTQEISQILRFCNKEGISVCTQGGNTGLVGGATPTSNREIILCTQKLDRIIEYQSGIIHCQAGCILENLNKYLATKHDAMMPLDLGAKGSCQIGGNVATNAGGLRVLRYGGLQGSIVGIKAVMADGSIFDDLSWMRKNNTGLALKNLFVGSEGTLGVISEVKMLTVPIPKSTLVAVLGAESIEEAREIFKMAKHQLGEILSAFEFWDRECNHLLSRSGHHLLSGSHQFNVLIESGGMNAEHDTEKMMNFLQDYNTVFNKDGILSQDQGQVDKFWAAREAIPELSAKHSERVCKFDISLPTAHIYEIVQRVREKLTEHSVLGYGHFGDGNLHLNILLQNRTNSADDLDKISAFVYDHVTRVGGSISAEHGIGQLKRKALLKQKSPLQLQLMRSIKSVFDPKGILNPNKIF